MSLGIPTNRLLPGLLAALILIPAALSAATVSTTVTAPANFEDISIAPDGMIYLPSQPGGNVIYQVTPEGQLSTLASVPASFPLGSAVTADGTLYMSLYNRNAVHKINPDGSTAAVLLNIAGPTGIAPSNDPRYIYVASYIWGAIYKVDLQMHTKLLLSNGPEHVGPDGLAVDPDENLYMANFRDSRIHKRTPAGDLTLLATLPGAGTGYLEYLDGILYVAGLNTRVVYTVDAETGAWEIFAGTGASGSSDGPAETATFTAINGLAISPDGQYLYVGEGGRLRRIDLSSAAPVIDTVPVTPQLHGAVPNPFNPRTAVHFSLAKTGDVRLSVMDVRGRQVHVLHDGALSSGDHAINWNGLNAKGLPVSSGTYFSRLETASVIEVKPMTLVR